MKSTLTELRWTALLFIAGITILASLFAIDALSSGRACPAFPNFAPWDCFEYWLNRYQGMIVGVLAVIGAGATVYFLQRQTRDFRAHAEHQFGMTNVAEGRALIHASSSSFQHLFYALQSIGAGLKTDDQRLIAEMVTLIETSPTFGEACRNLSLDTREMLWETLWRLRSDEGRKSRPVKPDEVKALFGRIEADRKAGVRKLHAAYDKRFRVVFGRPLDELPDDEAVNRQENEPVTAAAASKPEHTDATHGNAGSEASARHP